MADQEQFDEFLGALEAIGGHSGNGRLRDLLGWEEGIYEGVKAELVSKRIVVLGLGRGGSVALASRKGIREEPTSPEDSPPQPFAALPSTKALGPQPSSMQNLTCFIWSVADLLQGDYRSSEFGNVILPFVVLRRLDCLLDDTKAQVLAEKELCEAAGLDPEPSLIEKAGLPFYNTSQLDMKRLMADHEHIGENLRAYLQAFSPSVRDIFESFGFHIHIDRLAKAGLLYLVTERFALIDLRPMVVSNAEMGSVFEELIRKFAEESNESAGVHFTPRDVIKLMVNLVFNEDDEALSKPGVVRTIYDPTVGTGGMLSIGGEYMATHNPHVRLVMYGQELNAESYAICKADMLMKGHDIHNIILGNTLNHDGFKEQKFDYMLSNPPFGLDWSKIEEDIRKEADELRHEGRFGPGLPIVRDGSLLFLLHLVSKMRPAIDGGSRFGIVLNGSPLFTGGAGSGASEIRRYVLENDLVEAIVSLPSELFYNTGTSTYIWILSNRKLAARKGKVQLIDASSFWQKMPKSLGSKRKELSPEQIEEITQLFSRFEEEEKDGRAISKNLPNQAFGYRTITVERPLCDDAGKVVVGHEGKPMADSRLRDTENVPLSEDVQTYFERAVLPQVPDAWIGDEETKVGYDIPFKQLYARDFVIRQIANLETQYKTFRPGLIGEVTQAVRIHQGSARGNSSPLTKSQNSDHCLYIRSRRSGSMQISAAPFTSITAGDMLFEIDLSTDVYGAYLELFFKSPLGQLSLELACPRLEGVTIQNQAHWREIRKVSIPLPTRDQQLQIIETLIKMQSLKHAIECFEAGLSMDPTGSSTAIVQIDAMLKTLNRLSEADHIRGIVREGESKLTEFKQTLALDVKKCTKEKYIEESALKTVVAFLNTQGGTLLIGVADNGDIIGIEREIAMLFKSRDSFLLHWKNLLQARIGEQFYPFVDTRTATVGSVQVLLVSCRSSPTPCYLDGRVFYVRTNPATDKLEGPQLVEYVKNHFQ
jgi:type I restriction enzyme M protein